jgi:hypothetical protein
MVASLSESNHDLPRSGVVQDELANRTPGLDNSVVDMLATEPHSLCVPTKQQSRVKDVSG